MCVSYIAEFFVLHWDITVNCDISIYTFSCVNLLCPLLLCTADICFLIISFWEFHLWKMCSRCVSIIYFLHILQKRTLYSRTISVECWWVCVFGVIVLSQCFFRINKAGLSAAAKHNYWKKLQHISTKKFFYLCTQQRKEMKPISHKQRGQKKTERGFGGEFLFILWLWL